MSDQPAIKYKWKREPGGVWEIYHGNDGDRRIGRVEGAVVGKHFNWYMNFQHGIRDLSKIQGLYGTAPSAREAATACEACYDAVLACTWPGMTKEELENLLGQERFLKERREQWRREEEEERQRRS